MEMAMPDAPANKVEVFRALCWARATQWRQCALADEHGYNAWIGHAVDPLQKWAVENGLVRLIGQDAVQAIMADEFGEARRGGDRHD